MTKKEIRNAYREKRKALSPVERNKLDDLLLVKFQTTSIPFIQTLFSFWPIEKNSEPNMHLVTDFLEFKNPGLIVAYPRMDFMLNEMVAISTDETTEFEMNEFDVYEPLDGIHIPAAGMDMVLVPLLAFDKKGYRVGYGKGYYDKFLSGCRKDCIKAGFSYFEPVDEITDKEVFDVPLDLCITPQTVYVF